MEEKSSILDKITIFFRNINETPKVVTYGIASISLFVVLNRIKPFAKYTKPSNIPSRFLRKRMPLQGTVMRIEPTCGTLLMVEHKPLIPLPGWTSQKYLPVKIAGVTVTANGISWLQTVVKHNQIVFIPIAKEEEYLECMVLMQENEGYMKVGQELVKLGFAMVHKIPLQVPKDKQLLMYEKCLLSAQKWAERRRNGCWHFMIHPTLLWKVQESLNRMKSVLSMSVARKLNI